MEHTARRHNPLVRFLCCVAAENKQGSKNETVYCCDRESDMLLWLNLFSLLCCGHAARCLGFQLSVCPSWLDGTCDPFGPDCSCGWLCCVRNYDSDFCLRCSDLIWNVRLVLVSCDPVWVTGESAPRTISSLSLSILSPICSSAVPMILCLSG